MPSLEPHILLASNCITWGMPGGLVRLLVHLLKTQSAGCMPQVVRSLQALSNMPKQYQQQPLQPQQLQQDHSRLHHHHQQQQCEPKSRHISLQDVPKPWAEVLLRTMRKQAHAASQGKPKVCWPSSIPFAKFIGVLKAPFATPAQPPAISRVKIYQGQTQSSAQMLCYGRFHHIPLA